MTIKATTGNRLNLFLIFILGLTLISSSVSFEAHAATFAYEGFQQQWRYTDELVSEGKVSRTYLWGPEPFTGGIQEDYMEAPGGKRLVQYFDKSRMEVTDLNGDKFDPFFITNGLLAREMMSGQLQLGNAMFETHEPANIGVAGDLDDTSGPTYKALNGLTNGTTDNTGNQVLKAVDHFGNKRDGTAEFGKYNIIQAHFESSTQHNIAAPFWAFLNQSGQLLNPVGLNYEGRLFDPLFYATGLPITDAWWAKVKVGGVVKDVLVQAFERRVLTFTPSNPAAFQVEMGNIGRHYYLWRYGTGSGTTTTPPPTTTSEVMIHNFSFQPQTITVARGTTVTWTNMDITNHTITSNTVDSGPMGKGDTFQFTFNTPGTFSYHCSIHETMTGTVIVTN